MKNILNIKICYYVFGSSVSWWQKNDIKNLVNCKEKITGPGKSISVFEINFCASNIHLEQLYN